MEPDSAAADQQTETLDTAESTAAVYHAAADADIHDLRIMRRIQELLPEIRTTIETEGIMEPVRWRAQHALGAMFDRVSRICARDLMDTEV